MACVVADSGSPNASYEAVRFNAMKHHILSRLAVLAHEDSAEFTDLLAALLDEHQPAGMMERHQMIIWRKRRVLLAEGAKINENLNSSPRTVMPSAASFQRGLSGESTDLLDLFDSTPQNTDDSLKSAEIDLATGRKAAAILRKGGANAYEKARRALIPESRDWWDERVADERHPATAEGLAEFIRVSLESICYRMVQEVRFARRSRRKPWVKGSTRTD